MELQKLWRPNGLEIIDTYLYNGVYYTTMKKQIHLKPGDKFNKLTVLSFHHTGKHFRKYYLFKCDCGNEKIILGSGVTTENTKSCGCLIKETCKNKILPDHGCGKNNLILQYKRHAKNRGLEFELTKDIFLKLIGQPCYYCGLLPSNIKRTKNDSEGFLYSGIDRIDSNIGYIIDNVVPCCNQCNKSKMAISKIEFLDWVKRVYTHQWG